jgi:hypothetical protein
MPDKTEGPRSTDSPSEAQAAPPVAQGDYAYNAPDLSPLAFLLAVVHDKSVDINHRIHAAECAMPYTAHPQGLRWEDRDPMDRLTILINVDGIIPNNVRASFVMPGINPFTEPPQTRVH